MEKKLYIPEFGTECAYTIMGKGPQVMLLHGLCESQEVWKKHAEIVAREYCVITLDLPGYGNSTPFVDNDFSLERIQKAVFAIADAEGFEKFSLVGHSMGGYTALAMLEAQPKRIKGLALYHSTCYADTDEKKKGRDKSVKVLLQNRDLFFREVFKNLFNSTRLSEFMPLVQHLYSQSAKIATQTVTSTLIALRDRKDRYDILNRSKVYISYFIGRHDNVLAANDLLNEAKKLGVNYYVAENVGHMGFYESPKETEEYLWEFLQNAEATA